MLENRRELYSFIQRLFRRSLRAGGLLQESGWRSQGFLGFPHIDVGNRSHDGGVLRSIWLGNCKQMLTNAHNFGVTERVN